jgi:hypothetical protein
MNNLACLISRALLVDEQMSNIVPETANPTLAELSRKTGLVLRSADPLAVNNLFAEFEKYESQQRAETFEYLRRSLNKTRASLGAEPAYLDK